MLDGSGVKATPESIPTPNSGSLQKNKKNTGSQMGHTKKIFKKKTIYRITYMTAVSNTRPTDRMRLPRGSNAAREHLKILQVFFLNS